MATNENVNIQINSKADLKGFKEAETAATKLNKTIKNLASTIGVAYGSQALASFAKQSVKAFIADEEAANRLSLAVKNLGMEFANPYISEYIKNLEQTSKVADDQLRPAFQSLLQQTGSLTKAQSILNTAIEVSRGSGTDLSTVANDLAQAYVGNTKGLKKYYLGLTTAELKAKSFVDIQKIMNDQFTGSSAAYLSTYSGQVGVLSLAWQNFQENVGGALLTMASFGSGGKAGGLSKLATVLDSIGKAVNLIATGWDSVAKLFNVTGQGGLLSKFNPYGGSSPSMKKDDSAKSIDKYQELLAKIEKERNKQNQLILKNQKALTAEQKKQALLKKQGTLFDMEQIQLVAALKGKLSDEERDRVKLQLALLQGNEEEAARLSAKIADTIDKTGQLKRYLNDFTINNDPFKVWMDSLERIAAKASSISSMASAGTGATSTAPSGTADYGGNIIGSLIPNFTPTTQYNTGGAATTVNVQVDGKTIASALLDQSLSGNQSYVDRRTGGFNW